MFGLVGRTAFGVFLARERRATKHYRFILGFFFSIISLIAMTLLPQRNKPALPES